MSESNDGISRQAESGASSLVVVRHAAALGAEVARWHAAGESVGLVPTMGALHAAHISLIEHIASEVDRVIVSIFVNPAQFGPNEDFSRYPRNERRDLEVLSTTPADLAYLPVAEEMYPPGFATSVHPQGPAEGLEGAHRPGHFDGVATVVVKLFEQTRCDAAVFGEKDYQQLAVLRRVAADLDLPQRILAAPTVREADGLAMSSRNAYLDEAQRAIAPALHRILAELAARAKHGEALRALEAAGKQALIAAGFDAVDYVAFRDAASLAVVERIEGEVRLLAAAYLGATRLIDNLAVD